MLLKETKIILDLCGGTGAWSKPYQEAGYDVRIITLPQNDVRLWTGYMDLEVYGILAAPPCTCFAISGARWERTEEQMIDALSIVDACLRIVWYCKPNWWALENPVGRLPQFIGPYQYTFQPFEYGDPWTKRTCIWGEHVKPRVKNPVKPIGQCTGTEEYVPPDWVHKLPPSPDRTKLRSVTPSGFAQAFFEANP